MHCAFPGRNEEVPVTVIEASMSGARLLLAHLQFGRYHLLVDSSMIGFALTVHMPEAPLTSEINIMWYNWSDEEQLFSVGVQFSGMTEENQLALQRAIKEMTRTKDPG